MVTATALSNDLNMNSNRQFKESEVGNIPPDWDAKPLFAIADMKSGEGITARDINDHSQHPCYGGNGLRGFTSTYTHDGTYALVGRQGALCGNVCLVSGKFFASEHAIVVAPKEETEVRWLGYVLTGLNLNNYSESSAQPGLSVEKIKKLIVATPPTKIEQGAIANALSDADALIESQETLIAKKRAIKQGALQNLLFGQIRLPGFSGEWKIRNIGGIASIRNEKINTYGHPLAETCVELEDIEQASGRIIACSDARNRQAIKYKFATGDVLFGRLRPYLRKFWRADRAGVCSTEIWPLTPSRPELDAGFLAHIVQTDAFIEAASAAYGTHMPRADWKSLADLSFSLPPTIEEQSAIADILSAMDEEIDALENKLSKARSIRQGMMQELLTGRVRLV